jgi:feruloyl esterase
MRRLVSLGFHWAVLIAGLGSAHAGSCESLSALSLSKTSISVAQEVPAGTFNPPYGNAVKDLPSFCRVAGVIQASADSYIRFEVWLPANGWNGKYRGVGNGGFAGSIDFSSLGNSIRRGYATAATDTGHEGEAADGSWAYKHPEKVVDYGYRALHLTTVNAKDLTKAFYNSAPQRSYFDSCSNGGREALVEAQRFPEDFDGILAGAPANNWTHMLAGGVDVSQVLYGNPAGYIPSVKLPAITAAVRAACDSQDGVKDGILNDPTRCHFDPNVLLCRGPESRTCLTASQITPLKKIYSGSQNSKGEPIFPGLIPGGEEGPGAWGSWVTGTGPGGGPGYIENFLRYMVFEDPGWSVLKGNVDEAVRAADAKTASILNATDPDLHRFQSRGGKLIMYHGWNDAAISPLNSVNYFNNVVAKMGTDQTGQFIRLYMAPGVQHCTGGVGPSSFGQLGQTTAKGSKYGLADALESWAEKGTAPGEITATKYNGSTVEMTRPLCAYPEVPKYNGTGDTNDAASFICASPDR